MKRFILLIVAILYVFSLSAQPPMITEISYDNNYDQDDPFGIDSIEYVEVYLPNPQPADLSQWRVVSYNASSSDNSVAEFEFTRDLLNNTIRSQATPNGMYYVVEFPDSTFFGFPLGGIRDGQDGLALVELGSPNTVYQFWRYETCDPFTAVDGPAMGATSNSITQDFSRVCGSPGASLVQMNSALQTDRTLQQNGFGDWYLGLNTSRMIPLENAQNVPVELISFEGERRAKNVELTWSTASETNNDYFDVTHSSNGVEFTSIGRIKGTGESTAIQDYQFTHRNANAGFNYYRLIQHDFDGTQENVGQIVVKGLPDSDIYIYPTRVSQELIIKGLERPSDASIYDISGNLITSFVNVQNTIDVSTLNNGMYFLKVGEQIMKFIKF